MYYRSRELSFTFTVTDVSIPAYHAIKEYGRKQVELHALTSTSLERRPVPLATRSEAQALNAWMLRL
jgi:hypothetical protein